jgi:hypothetical protein
MLLQETFYVSDYTYSATAEKLGIDNGKMTSEQLICLMDLQKMLWQLQGALTAKFKKEILLFLNSAFRSKILNDYFVKTIGASKTSQHMDGQASDLSVVGITLEQLFVALKEFAKEGIITFGQVILEYGTHLEKSTDDWCHVSTPTKTHKNQFETHEYGKEYIIVKL